VRRVMGPRSAAALPEIMAGAGQDGKLQVAPWPCRKASLMCLFRSSKAEQQASNREAPPEHAEVERQKPERGLTLRLTGGPKARPS